MQTLTPLMRDKLQALKCRAENLTLFGTTADGRPLGPAIAEQIAETLKANGKDLDEQTKKLGKLYRKAHRGDEDAQAELCGLVIERTNNFVIPATNFGRFFEVRNLGPADNPGLKNETKTEIKFKYVGPDGRNETSRIISPRTTSSVDWHVLESEEVEYQTFNLYDGDVSDVARAQFDIDFDLAMAIESKLNPVSGLLSSGVFGAFTLTGDKTARVYNRHSKIRSGVLPTSNALAITGVGANTKLGQTTLEEIIQYCTRFAKTSPDGDLRPTGEIIVPADELIQVVNGITMTNAAQNATAQQVLERGFYELPALLGVNWRLVPDNVIAAGYAYPVLNKPVGILWRKPSYDYMEEKLIRNGRVARRFQSIAMTAAIPTPNYRNVIRVQYHT